MKEEREILQWAFLRKVRYLISVAVIDSIPFYIRYFPFLPSIVCIEASRRIQFTLPTLGLELEIGTAAYQHHEVPIFSTPYISSLPTAIHVDWIEVKDNSKGTVQPLVTVVSQIRS